MSNWLRDWRMANPEPPPFDCPPRYLRPPGEYPEPVREVADRYLKEFWIAAPEGRAPTMLGPTGQWKTTAACWIGWQVRQVMIGALYVNAAELHRLVLFRFGEGEPVLKARLEAMRAVPFLIVDDLHLAQPGTEELALIDEVAGHRFDHLMPTLWIANFRPREGLEQGDLGDRFGPRLARRIIEPAKGYTVLL